jgi:hypothetical protein
MRLSATVTDDDLNMAISCMLESFINAQKYGVQRALRRQFTRYLDAGVDVNTLLLNNLRAIVREQQALAFVQTGALRRGFDAMPDEVELTLASLEERLTPLESNAATAANGIGVLCELVKTSGLLSNASAESLRRLDDFTGAKRTEPTTRMLPAPGAQLLPSPPSVPAPQLHAMPSFMSAIMTPSPMNG